MQKSNGVVVYLLCIFHQKTLLWHHLVFTCIVIAETAKIAMKIINLKAISFTIGKIFNVSFVA